MLTILVFCAIALSEMASDIYVPGLPLIKEVLKTSTVLVHLTVSFNLAGIAISSLVYGLLSDCYGRRKVFLSGISIFALASLLCCVFENIYILIFLRFLQGVGAGVSSVVGHATIKDMYSGKVYAQIVSRLSMVVSLSPAIAPIIGGIILHHFDWRVVFFVIFTLVFILLVMLFFFCHETLPEEKREKFKLNRLFNSYAVVVSNYSFMTMAVIQSFVFMWLWNEIANLPFVFITVMGLKIEHYGYFVSATVLSYTLGTLINQKMVGRFGMRRMLLLGLVMTIIPDIVMLNLQVFVTLTPVIITMVWIPSLIGLAFIVTNSIAIAMSSVVSNATARASAVLAFVQMVSGALAIYVVGALFPISIITVCVTNIVCSVLALCVYFIGRRHLTVDC